jgi:hypothetical protein
LTTLDQAHIFPVKKEITTRVDGWSQAWKVRIGRGPRAQAGPARRPGHDIVGRRRSALLG